MFNTTLCYIEQDGKYLMLHRVKKQQDINKGKWIGVGGKFEEGESPDECLLREVREETGLTLTSYRCRGSSPSSIPPPPPRSICTSTPPMALPVSLPIAATRGFYNGSKNQRSFR